MSTTILSMLITSIGYLADIVTDTNAKQTDFANKKNVNTFENTNTFLGTTNIREAYFFNPLSQIYESFDPNTFITNTRGPKGDKGDKGDPGPAGPQGPQGPPGLTGPAGSQGQRGLQGLKGDKGDKGDDGPQGPRGALGIMGPKGYTGEKGDKGDKGDDGPRGLTGLTGATGTTGPQGPQGLKGDTGNQGIQGPAGPQGPQGPQGLKGDTGNQGLQGPAGPQGPQGLKGDTGNQGPQGPQGPTGIKGDVGMQGPQGIQGPKGDTGAQGPQGIPGPVSSNPTFDVVRLNKIFCPGYLDIECQNTFAINLISPTFIRKAGSLDTVDLRTSAFVGQENSFVQRQIFPRGISIRNATRHLLDTPCFVDYRTNHPTIFVLPTSPYEISSMYFLTPDLGKNRIEVHFPTLGSGFDGIVIEFRLLTENTDVSFRRINPDVRIRNQWNEEENPMFGDYDTYFKFIYLHNQLQQDRYNIRAGVWVLLQRSGSSSGSLKV